MSVRALPVLLAACIGCGQPACKRGTILLTIDNLVGARPGDAIDVDVISGDGKLALHGTSTLTSVKNGGTIELDVPGYPPGRTVTITAIVDGASGSTTLALGSSCTVATIALGSLSPGDGGLPRSDGAAMADLASVDLTPFGGPCTPGGSQDSCSGSTLHQCRSDGAGFVDVSCGLGCSTTPMPHCKGIVPSGAVTTADLSPAGLSAMTIASSATLHSDTGAIDGVRPANANASVVEIHNGIAFHVANGVGIFSFDGFTVASGTTLLLTGPNAVALVSAADLDVPGIIDARGTCSGTTAGPGGSAGGAAATNGQGAGSGSTPVNVTSDGRAPGGGGAGHGETGSKGGADDTNGNTTAGGAAGGIYDVQALVPLIGGSGGAGGWTGAGSGSRVGGTGGGGGGALQLVATGRIVIGGGAMVGGVNAGGCGGGGGLNGTTSTGAAGGGGGSGGAILLESPTIHVTSTGALATNGGGGGGGSDSSSGMPGQAGQLSIMPASGGTAPANSCANGGVGGVAGALAGTVGGHNCNHYGSGGGGGGVGRIRLNSASGSATIDSGAILSPRLNEMSSQSAAITTQATVSSN